eukprot:m51a1_g7648 hypothetical protein (690) ;mRNA; r:380001-382566
MARTRISLRTAVLASVVAAIVVTAGVFVGMAGVLLHYLAGIDKDDARDNAARVARALVGTAQALHVVQGQFAVNDEAAAAVSRAVASGRTGAMMAFLAELRRRGQEGSLKTRISLFAVFLPNCSHFFSIDVARMQQRPGAYWTSGAACREMKARPFGIANPVNYGIGPLVASLREIRRTGSGSPAVGFMYWGRPLEDVMPVLAGSADPACVRFDADTESSSAARGLRASGLPYDPAERWRGHVRVSSVDDRGQRNRTCPRTRTGTVTSRANAGYFVVANETSLPPGPLFRVDSPQSAVHAGTRVIAIVSAVMGGLVVVLGAVMFLYIQLVVLRRLERMTRSLDRLAPKRRSLRIVPGGPDEMASALSSDDDSSSTGIDEIDALGVALHHRVESRRARLQRALALLAEHRAASAARRRALAALSQCCWLSAGCPAGCEGLVAAAGGGRKAVRLERVLMDPLATECLKSFCAGDASLENAQFLVDTALFRDMHAAASVSGDPVQVLSTASRAAAAIREQYVADGAPSLLNTSAPLRQTVLQGSDYDPALFDSVVADVRQLVAADVVPRFAESPAFRGLCFLLDLQSPMPLADNVEAVRLVELVAEAQQRREENSNEARLVKVAAGAFVSAPVEVESVGDPRAFMGSPGGSSGAFMVDGVSPAGTPVGFRTPVDGTPSSAGLEYQLASLSPY